jgi:hypothetical protein
MATMPLFNNVGLLFIYFRYLQTAITTPVNKTRLIILNVRQIKSFEVNPEGAINSAHTHTPITQLMDMSIEERRRMILTIKGMLNNGMVMEAISPMFSIMFLRVLYGILLSRP